jgi:flagellar hook-associated protein 2
VSSITSTGIGSGLDVTTIISKLMAVESLPLQTMQQQQSSYQTDLTAFGTLSSALSTFQSSLTNLSNPATFTTLTAASSSSGVASASVNSSAIAGNYNLNVTQLAQGQTISSAGQVSSTAAIGSGTSTTVTFQFGSVTGTATGGTFSGATYTPDTTQSIGSITINSSNNSLQGIASAINSANIGVNASIVGDGSATPYHLVLSSANTGSNSTLKITATGDPALQNLLNYDPSGTQNFTQLTASQNANVTVNGIAVTSSSNTISNSVQGVTFTASSIGTASINVAPNTTAVTSGINSLISSYNNLNSTIAQLTAYNATTKQGGPLLGDPTIRALQNQIRSIFNSTVGGSGSSLNNLTQVGITLNSDGSLSLNSSKLQSAMSSNFSGVGTLFSSLGTTTDSLVNYVSSTSATQAGSYALNITALAQHGILTGNVNLNSAPVTIGANTTINVTVDGTTAAVNLSAGDYSAQQFAAQIQSAINGTSAFSNNGLTVNATIDSNGYLNLTSGSYGTTSNVSLSNSSGTSISTFAGTVTTGVNGTNVAGTINGISGIGNGQYLTGATGTSTEGLQVQINGGSTGDRGTISYSQGYAYQLSNLATSYLKPSTGIIANTTNGLNTQIKNVQNQITTFSANLTQIQANYQAQFSALDTLINSMTSTQSFLTQQIGVLNGTTNSK